MNKSSRLPKALLAACAFAAAVASSSALAEPVFNAQESAVPGSAANLVIADRMIFGYQAKIIQTIGGGSLAGADDPFTENGFLNKSGFELGAGNAVGSQLNGFGTGGYKIYGVFTITGEADPLGGTGILATFNTGTLQLFVDPDANTVLGFDGGNNVTVAGNGEDLLLANLSLLVGQAHVFGGLANGDFDTFLSFALTPYGSTYFVNPNPFFSLENFGGNTQTIVGGSLTDSFVATATGGGVELFQVVPEPGMLSLLGIAMAGLGFVGRRKNAV